MQLLVDVSDRSWYLPNSQLVQAPSAAYVPPATQVVHAAFVVLPAVAVACPDVHLMQLPLPGCGWYLPAGHLVQYSAFSAECVPAAQFLHSVACRYWPAVQFDGLHDLPEIGSRPLTAAVQARPPPQFWPRFSGSQESRALNQSKQASTSPFVGEANFDGVV